MSQTVGSASRSLPKFLAFSGLSSLGLALFLAGCSGASTNAGVVGSAGGAFQLSSISVDNGQTWQINRAIAFTFSVAPDFDTVNLNTISIQELNGAPAIGGFVQGSNPRTILFQPVCPTEADFSDAGFRPGGATYLINIPTTATGATTVMSAGGKPLTASFPSSFNTPDSSVLAELFLDTVPGAVETVTHPTLGTSIVIGAGADTTELFFQTDTGGTGNGILPAGTLVPNNFYSDESTHVVVNVRFNQPVSPRPENIHSSRIRLQFQAFGETDETEGWQDLSANLDLVTNCVGTGAWVQIVPTGILPQARNLRVVVTPEFEDLVGERNPDPLSRFATMTTGAAINGGGGFVDTADAFTENFLDDAFEDTLTALTFPRATWGADRLSAAFEFTGDGGPNGEFDLHIDGDVIFNTTFFEFNGGPGGGNQGTHTALGGKLNVRHLVINNNAILRIEGPNAAQILCTGNLVINGLIRVNGGNASSVFLANTPHLVEQGAPGQGGGGSGGDGSFLTTQVTPLGGNGEGAYGIANGGGFGGESGWSTDSTLNGEFRRAAGGGGGRLGHAQLEEFSLGPIIYFCPDQERIGLDPESGFPGGDQAISSQNEGVSIPYGGRMGPSPFPVTASRDDDFWGTKVMNIGDGDDEQLIIGELTALQPGSGGGAGGDATLVLPGETYPPPTLENGDQDKGAGGGGGAGAIEFLVLGNVTFGPLGKIEAVGGHGNGGESTNSSNRVGGGSGGGSGGHIVIQTARQINFSQVIVGNGIPAIDVKGGQGGVGADSLGGAFVGESAVALDAVHTGNIDLLTGPSNPLSITENPWILIAADDEHIDPQCILNDGLPADLNHVQGAGGDGGPGLIQLHVGRLYAGDGNPSDFVYPNSEADLRTICSPVPHGYNSFDEVWDDHLLPIFGRVSGVQSKWIPLGEPGQDPQSATLTPIEFLFEGTDASGLVEASGGVVTPQGALLTDPSIDVDSTDPMAPLVLIDGSSVDQVYRSNPSLLVDFRLEAGGVDYTVTSASYDENTSLFTIGVASPSSGLNTATGQVDLVPRFLAVSTFHPVPDAGDVVHGAHAVYQPDELIAGQGVQIEFELMYGDDNTVSGFNNDLDLIANGVPANEKVRFIRYRVTFDLGANPNGGTVRPTLDFLKIPFKF